MIAEVGHVAGVVLMVLFVGMVATGLAALVLCGVAALADWRAERRQVRRNRPSALPATHPARRVPKPRVSPDRHAKPLTVREREQWDALVADLSTIVLPPRVDWQADTDAACDLTRRDEGGNR